MTSCLRAVLTAGALTLAICLQGCSPPACSALTCNGCCDSAGSCLSGAAQATCGAHGFQCVRCGEGLTCSSGVCAAQTGGCDAASCPYGCCAQGVCTPWAQQTVNACGASGNSCSSCGAALSCQQGVCKMDQVADAGTDGGTDAGSGPCVGRPPGNYCGSRLGLDPATRYQCGTAAAAASLGPCAEGCEVTLVGTNDRCYQANCTGQVSGLYCGSDNIVGNPGLLYRCAAGAVSTFSPCASECLTMPPGTDDKCAAAPAGAPANVRAAPGNGFVELRWNPATIPDGGFAISSSPATATSTAGSSATSARIAGLTNATSYTFTVTPSGGPASNPSNAVTPSVEANVIADVPHYKQQRSLTCEESALSMALVHAGISKTETQVLTDIGVDLRPSSIDAGVLYWGDPFTTFVGDPDGSEVTMTGYGTYWPNLDRVARQYGATVLVAGENLTPAELYAQVLAGHPAVVWIGYDFAYHPASMTWITFAGTTTTWHGPIEHAVVVVGITPGAVLINNPAHAAEWDWVSRTVFENGWRTFGNMAVVLQ